jgi:hypothetical protein
MEEKEMRRAVLICSLLCEVLIPAASASYVVDGSLSDWGVTPFTNWIPNAGVNYTVTNNVNLYNASAYNETYDVEAMYFASDPQKYYFAVVGSAGDLRMGDLGLDFNGNMTISEHGVVQGLEYAIQLDTGNLLLNPTWSDTSKYQWPDGWQGSPYKATGGTVVGSASVVIQSYPALESGTFVIEVGVDRTLFAGMGIGDIIGEHYTMWCGNDSINLPGTVGTLQGQIPVESPVPAPAGLLLAGLGLSVVGGLRRRKLI